MTASTQKFLLLIDGSSYFHRAYHALPPLLTSKGEPTGAVYGVINMIRKLINDFDPEFIAVVFDAKGKTFRHELYPKYKANRPPMPDDLKIQIQPLQEVIQAMGLPLLTIEGVEADDVIGTLANIGKQAGQKVMISTSDKDFAQLVDGDITLINTMSNTKLDHEGVIAKFGIPPERIIDYLTLVGDTSDNVPGVMGVGPKTAVKWLQEYGSLENIIKNADQITGKVGENLRASLEQLKLTKNLVTIKNDVQLKLSLQDLKRQQPDNTKLQELFTHLEFKTWLAGISETPQQSTAFETNYTAILSEETFQQLYTQLQNTPAFSLDLETTSLDTLQAQIVGISVAPQGMPAVYIPVAHDYLGAPEQLSRTRVLEKLKPLLEDPNKIKLGQNLKYDMSVLANYGIELGGVGFDTMLESYLLNSASNQHDKETLALRYLGKSIITYEKVAGKGAKQIPFNQVSIDKATEYAAADADIVWQLHNILWPQISQDEKQKRIFQQIEIPLITVLSHMERCGVCIDKNNLQQQSIEITTRLSEIENEVYSLADVTFNLNSPQQLSEVLYNKLQLPILQKTPGGQPSTAESVLQELALNFPLPKLLLEHRSLSKLKSTYTDSLPLQINSRTGRVHTSYNQAITSTGRLSSTNPNLQNIPIRTEAGRRIRQAFIAPLGCKIISADYSQIELRIMAHLSHDPSLREAFARDADIHRATAAEVFSASLDSVTAEQRRHAKTINFGLIYGMSAFGLAQRLGMDRHTAQKYVDLYFSRYPGVKNYMEQMRLIAQTNGYVETISGRRLYMPDINSKNFARRAAAARAAINAPMQGSAADMMKIAMINIDNWIKKSNLNIKMIMQVHDELVFEVAENDVQKVIPEIKELMETAIKIDVPVIVDVGEGNNWDEAH